ncbi:FHA domain-containing protein [Acidimicrobiaceae bacterium USS-CC1]|uniref:FHA domain-containing protein n=1 Tax=Acidiferrimicrobium australe TaxID=2664430 RepID=A0ABW9QTI1_9ACTN|nr:FHA domain-containing protein [Acidiferrimicrobium australe]
MSTPLLTILKYVFLAVLYLFFLRVLRAVWIELREPKVTTVEAGGTPLGAPRPSVAPVPVDGSDPPTIVTGLGPETLVEAGPDGLPGRRFPVGNEMSIGRSPGCGVALPEDTFVSQVHARVFRRDGMVWVEDLGSTNGTYVNDSRVDGAAPLRPGDRLHVGQTVLELST